MIICSCNLLSDRQVRDVLSASAVLPQTASEVQSRLGCRTQCGCCARTLKAMIRVGPCDPELVKVLA
jgi:bacterioferritin-associated ferredoxin